MQLTKHNKQIGILYSTTLIGTFLGVLSSIINTDFIDPVDYGDVRYVQNIMNFVSTILMLGIYQSGSRLLALSESEDYSRKIRGAMILILLFTCFVMSFSSYIIGQFQISHSLSVLFQLTSIVCSYPLLINYINTTAQGDNHIVRLSIARIMPSMLYVPIAYMVYSKIGADSKIMMLLQWGIYSIVCIILIWSTHPSFKDLRGVFKSLIDENKRYGIHLYEGSLIMVATNYLAGITLGHFSMNNANVGFYTLALTVTGPLIMLPSIIGTTYFKEFAKLNRIPTKVLTLTILLTVLSCIIFIVLIHPVVKLLYSEEYSSVGIYASWLALGYSMHGLGDMFNRYLGSHGQGKSIRNSSFICGTIKILGFIFLVYYFNITGAILTMVLSSAIYLGCMVCYYTAFVRAEEIK